MDQAILCTVAYADVFDHPLTVAEIHRYLVGLTAPLSAVHDALLGSGLVPQRLACREGYFALPGREAVIETRRRREEVARRMWPRALRYGRIMASLPFVRMVAVSGALTMDNVEADADLDYFIVTEQGRLWLCRAIIVALVRLVAQRGDVVCPNYLLTEQALFMRERNLFTAHEIVQMVPVSGWEVYQRLRQTNAWTTSFLPNAQRPPAPGSAAGVSWRPVRAALEAALRTPVGTRLERWEMARKVNKLSQQAGGQEAAFCADWCKGHFAGHGQHTLEALARRLQELEEKGLISCLLHAAP